MCSVNALTSSTNSAIDSARSDAEEWLVEVIKSIRLRVGLRVGLGVGLPLLAALGVLAVLLGRERRRSRKSRERADGALPGGGGKGVLGGSTRYDKVGAGHKMTGDDSINEMAAMQERRELGVA